LFGRLVEALSASFDVSNHPVSSNSNEDSVQDCSLDLIVHRLCLRHAPESIECIARRRPNDFFGRPIGRLACKHNSGINAVVTADVCYWPLVDIPICTANVRFGPAYTGPIAATNIAAAAKRRDRFGLAISRQSFVEDGVFPR
jgi:hypothetical protein